MLGAYVPKSVGSQCPLPFGGGPDARCIDRRRRTGGRRGRDAAGARRRARPPDRSRRVPARQALRRYREPRRPRDPAPARDGGDARRQGPADRRHVRHGGRRRHRRPLSERVARAIAGAAGARRRPAGSGRCSRRAIRGARCRPSCACGPPTRHPLPVSSSAVDGSERTIRSRVVIAADGRRSTIAFGLGLARHPRRPRRWAIGGYFENVQRMSSLGEMHIRRGRYIGVAPLPGGIVNVCLVRPSQPADDALRDTVALLRQELARDPVLADRFVGCAAGGVLRSCSVLWPSIAPARRCGDSCWRVTRPASSIR